MIQKDFTINEAKQIDLIEYLVSLGLQPTQISGNNYWFISPFPDRNEKTASLKVDRRKNTWKDFGDGRGGSIIDFCICYFQKSIPEVLQILSGKQTDVKPFIKPVQSFVDESEKIKIVSESVISNGYLIAYLHERRISLNIANKYCCEVGFTNHGKQYKAIGFKNNFGGFELRNKYFKGSSSPKDITFIDNHSACVLDVFEGFIDFLSYHMLGRPNEGKIPDYLVLNSTSFFERAKSIMDKYAAVNLFLDNDETGKKLTSQAIKYNPRYNDKSNLYHNYKDLNEMLTRFGQTEKYNQQRCIKP